MAVKFISGYFILESNLAKKNIQIYSSVVGRNVQYNTFILHINGGTAWILKTPLIETWDHTCARVQPRTFLGHTPFPCWGWIFMQLSVDSFWIQVITSKTYSSCPLSIRLLSESPEKNANLILNLSLCWDPRQQIWRCICFQHAQSPLWEQHSMYPEGRQQLLSEYQFTS